jgi:hypothetical protein
VEHLNAQPFHTYDKMKKYLLIIILFLDADINLLGQSISISFGTVYQKSKAEVPVINAKRDFSNYDYPFQLGVEYYIPKTKLAINATYFGYSGFTNMLLDEPYDPNFPFFHADGHGFNGTNIKRFSVEVKYSIPKVNNSFILRTGLGLGLQTSKSNGFELLNVPILGPNNVETAPLEANVYNTIQILPVGSIEIGYRFFKRVELSLYAQGAIGHKPYQKLTLKYTYKGTPRPDAISISDGTSIYLALKLGYRFHDLMKK